MIIPEKTVPSASFQSLLPAFHHSLQFHERQRRQIPLFFSFLLVQTDVFKLEHHGELAAVRIAVQLCILCIGSPCLSYSDQISLLKNVSAHLPDKLMKPRPVGRDLPVRFLGDLINDIQPEASHALFDPPVDHIVYFLAYCRIVPVEIRLFHRELMKIVLLYFRNPLPGRAAEGCSHIIGRGSLFSVSPYVIIMVRILPALLRLLEPAVFIRCVVQHQIHDNPDMMLSRLPDQLLHIRHSAKHGIDILIVGYIIPVVILRRSVYRGQPYCIDPQIFQIIQSPHDAGQVPDPVTVAVLKALRIYLIYYCFLPPFHVLL